MLALSSSSSASASSLHMDSLPRFQNSLHDHRPPKRPRPAFDDDDGIHPYSPPTLIASTSMSLPDHDHPADAASKKARKRPLSCGECRRLKLKCDRVFPCQSCVKRGCAEICPDGALTGGKGSRFILANTEQLHEKIKAMSERIRQLEEGLQVLQAQHSTETHPLLRQELLHIKRSPELFGIESRNGTTNHHAHDTQRRDEEEHDHPSVSSPPQPDTDDYTIASRQPGIPDDIARLSRAFPFPSSITSELDPLLRQRIRDMLPPQAEAFRICEQARLNAFWHYNLDCSDSLIPNLLHSVYTTPLTELLPHRLSLFLMILAIGTMVDLHEDPSRPFADKYQRSDRYHNLARAALCEVPIIDEPSFDTINSLFYMVWYLLMFSHHKKAVEHAWGLMGLVARLAQSLGLHRDGVRMKMIPEELDKRKALFWNLLHVDVRLALMLRRPPAISMRYADVKPPVYNLEYDSPSTTATSHYHSWRDSFLAQCIIPAMEISVTPQAAAYSDILGLDCRIRDFAIPPILRMVDNDGVAPNHPVGMQQALTLAAREVAIVNLHRSCFTQAFDGPEGFDERHKYAPSVYAVCLSACNIIWAASTLCKWEPDLTPRMATIWQNTFSAALALCLIISCAPASPLATRALSDLDRALELLLSVRDKCPAASKALLVLEDTAPRARTSYARWHNGLGKSDGDGNEMCQLARRTGLIVPSSGGARTDADGDAFAHAHLTLRRAAEHAAAEGRPRGEFGLPRGAPVVGAVYSSTAGVSQAYSTSAERTGGGRDRELAEPEPPVVPARSAWAGADLQDSSWMTWF